MRSTSTGKTILWGALFALTLLTILTPIGLLTIHVLLVPLLVMATVSTRLRFALTFAAVVIVPVILFGPGGWFLSLLALFYLPPALAMASQYRKGAGAGAAVIAGIVAFIASFLLLLLVAYSFRLNITEMFTDSLRTDKALMTLFESMFNSPELIDKAIEMLIGMIPFMLIVVSAYTAVLGHYVARKLLTAYWKPVPRLRPMKDWKLPKSIVWYYLIALLLDMFFRFEPGSTMYVIMLNAVPLLTYALALQGVAFLFFVADRKGWPRALPMISFVLVAIFPQLVAWLGVIDVALPLRSRMSPKE